MNCKGVNEYLAFLLVCFWYSFVLVINCALCCVRWFQPLHPEAVLLHLVSSLKQAAEDKRRLLSVMLADL